MSLVLSNFILDWKKTFFQGGCRDSSENYDVIDQINDVSLDRCMSKCGFTDKCVAFAYLELKKVCLLYRGGPYTHGTDNQTMKCYVLNSDNRKLFQ